MLWMDWAMLWMDWVMLWMDWVMLWICSRFEGEIPARCREEPILRDRCTMMPYPSLLAGFPGRSAHVRRWADLCRCGLGQDDPELQVSSAPSCVLGPIQYSLDLRLMVNDGIDEFAPSVQAGWACLHRSASHRIYICRILHLVIRLPLSSPSHSPFPGSAHPTASPPPASP